MIQVKFFSKIFALLLLFAFLSETVMAMRCGSHIITAGEVNGITRGEVQSKCGAPYSTYGNTWVYIKGNEVYRLKFSGSTLEEIHQEMKR